MIVNLAWGEFVKCVKSRIQINLISIAWGPAWMRRRISYGPSFVRYIEESSYSLGGEVKYFLIKSFNFLKNLSLT